MGSLGRHVSRVALSLILVALGIGISILPAAQGASAAPGPAPVVVTNTPLPVQGLVSAAQSGPWSVAIDNMPRVSVASLPEVRVASLPTPAAFQVELCHNPLLISLCMGTPYQLVIPSGTRFVIEYVSGVCTQPGAEVNGIFVATTASGSGPLEHFVPSRTSSRPPGRP